VARLARAASRRCFPHHRPSPLSCPTAKDVRNLRIMPDDRYPFREIETKWQRIWEDTKQFRVREDPGRSKYYCLEMFRTVGDHMGTCASTRSATSSRASSGCAVQRAASDGWDAFGCRPRTPHRERCAPVIWTYENIDTCAPAHEDGISYDWDREVTTAIRLLPWSSSSSSRCSSGVSPTENARP